MNISIIILTALIGIAIGIIAATVFWKNINEQLNAEYKKISRYYYIFSEWLSNEFYDRKTEQFFIKNDYKSVAIYGMKELGVHLWEMLKDTNIRVEYVIDMNPEVVSDNIKCYKPSDELPKVDVIVVTASYYFNEISKQLRHTGYPIVSLEDVIYYRYEEE